MFCGSNQGRRDAYAEAAAELGLALGERGIGLVYGGGDVGLMGILADAALAAGASVVGVIPAVLEAKEIAHQGLTELRVTSSMHERKAVMSDLADAFIALPGGLGTFEELCEILTWAQLGHHAKPVVVLDVEDYYAPLFALLDQAVAEGFLRPEHRALAHRAVGVAAALDVLGQPPLPPLPKWLDRSQT